MKNQATQGIVAVVLVAVLATAGYYFMKLDISPSSSTETAVVATVHPDQESVHAALVLYGQTNFAGLAAKDPYKITDFKVSGDYARFSFSPVVYVNDIDSAFGYAKKTDGVWKIIEKSVGTGGDPTAFYAENSIPKELRDAGY